jgi:hypothetical protein
MREERKGTKKPARRRYLGEQRDGLRKDVDEEASRVNECCMTYITTGDMAVNCERQGQ